MGIRDYVPPPPPPPSPPHPPPPSPSPPPPPKLPNDGVLERIYEGEAKESTDTSLRYAGYGMRIRTLLNATHRYVAYTSDIGESFRPVAHQWLVRSAYAISWVYITGDVAYEGYRAYLNNQAQLRGLPPPHPTSVQHHNNNHTPVATSPGLQATPTPTSAPTPNKIRLQDDYRAMAAQRFIFQTIASMALPAFTIHSVVRYSGQAMKNVRNPRLRTWGPVGLGLAVVPALPYLFDEPVEKAVEKGFEIVAGMIEGGGEGRRNTDL